MCLGFTDCVHVDGHLSDDVILEHGSLAFELLEPVKKSVSIRSLETVVYDERTNPILVFSTFDSYSIRPPEIWAFMVMTVSSSFLDPFAAVVSAALCDWKKVVSTCDQSLHRETDSQLWHFPPLLVVSKVPTLCYPHLPFASQPPMLAYQTRSRA